MKVKSLWLRALYLEPQRILILPQALWVMLWGEREGEARAMQVTVSVHSCTLKLLELTVEINKVAGASSNTDTNRISMY